MPVYIGTRKALLTLKEGGGNWWEQPQWDDFAAVPDLENWRFALPAWGPELVVNGDMSSATGWTDASSAPSTFAVAGGVGTLTGDGTNNARARQTFATTPGELYQFEVDVLSSTVSVLFGSTGAGSLDLVFQVNQTGNGLKYQFIAKTTTTYFQFGRTAVGAATFDNVSLRQVILTRGGAALGANLGASGYTLKSPAIGTETMTESPAGTLNLTGDGVNSAWADKSFTTVIGRKYRVMFSCATNQASFRVGTSQGGTQNIDAPLPGTGFITYEFTATATTQWVRFSRGSTGIAVVSAIEIRELPATGAFPKRSATFSEYYAFTAPSTTQRSYVDSTSVQRNDLAANEPRRDWRTGVHSWRLEDARTNSIRNNSMVGASAPSTFPTNWSYAGGIVPTVVGTGVENGLPYIDFRYQGVAGGTYTDLRFEAVNGIASANGVTWAESASLSIVGGSLANITGLSLNANQFDSGSIFLSTINFVSGLNALITSTPTRFSGAGATNNASIAYFRPQLTLNHTNSTAVDITIRIAAPQMEVGAFASDPIITTTVAVARAIETARFSPLVLAILQRAANSVVVRAQGTSIGRLIGGNTSEDFPGVSNTSQVEMWNGSVSIQANFPSGTRDGAFGAAIGFDSGGRSLSGNGSAVVSDANGPGSRAQVFLARAGTVSAAVPYAFGNYKLGGAISPERLSNAKLQALAVA